MCPICAESFKIELVYEKKGGYKKLSLDGIIVKGETHFVHVMEQL